MGRLGEGEQDQDARGKQYVASQDRAGQQLGHPADEVERKSGT